jgi:predicted nucleic acid-binding protein
VKYALDTNLYVRAIREPVFGAELADFHAHHAPRTFLSSVVFYEVAVGAVSPAKLAEINAWIGRPFQRTGRTFAPSHHAWAEGGEALGTLAQRHGLDRGKLPRSFVNDVLLAASCREHGITLVTDNTRDFERIQSVVRFEFQAPWPSG